MSTRGIYGFYKNGKYKVTYNHCDSYIDGLGRNIIEFVKNTTIDEMNYIFDEITMIKEPEGYGVLCNENMLDNEQRIHLLNFYRNNETVITFVDEDDCEISDIDYLNLTDDKIMRPFEGDLNYYKQGLVLMLDYESQLFNEDYTYIVNLDTNKLDIYTDIYKKNKPFRSYSFEELKVNTDKLVKEIEKEIKALYDAEDEDDEEVIKIETLTERIYKKIDDLGLNKIEDYETWVYTGDSYTDKQDNMYCVISSEENNLLDIPKGTHLYHIETGDEADDVSFILIV
jgi:hypothetical protein